jgi:four helix bundle protein
MNMATFTSFEEIESWQRSRVLIRQIREICKRQSAKNDFSFTDQITRAARSISANIAEGNDASTAKEFAKYLSYAKRSCAEVNSHLYDALDEKYISQKEFNELEISCKEICKMLGGLIKYLQKLSPRATRNY